MEANVQWMNQKVNNKLITLHDDYMTIKLCTGLDIEAHTGAQKQQMEGADCWGSVAGKRMVK